MRRVQTEIIETIRSSPRTVSELAERLDKSQGWISEGVSELEDRNLIERDSTGKVRISDTYEGRLLRELAEKYSLEQVLAGKREEILEKLVEENKNASEIQRHSYPESTVYNTLKSLRSAGAISRDSEGRHQIADETLRDFLKANREAGTGYESRTGKERIYKSRPGKEEESAYKTAFSAFSRYDVEYHPREKYFYWSKDGNSPRIEDVLIHAVKFAETKRQTSICAVFYLRHSSVLDADALWKKARDWDCVEEWADLLAHVDRRDIHQQELYLPWEEFVKTAREYGVHPRGKHSEESLLRGLEDVGQELDGKVEAYLLGGGNLILRGIKDSTKDLDIVVESPRELKKLVEALKSIGYEEKTDLGSVYEELNPSAVLEKQGFPRWDIFVGVVAGQLRLRNEMKRRVTERRQYGSLEVGLLSLEDIFVFKSITDREGDLEDVAAVVRKSELDWGAAFDEIISQEENLDSLVSFSVLDTVEILGDHYSIDLPIKTDLVSHCLEKAIFVVIHEEEGATIKEFRESLDFADHRIYNKLRELEEEGSIEVDRSGKLNEYSLSN